MSVSLRFFLKGPIVGIPQVALAKTAGQFAVTVCRDLSPFRTGTLEGGWSYSVSRRLGGVIVRVDNPVSYAGIVFGRKRIREVQRRVSVYWQQLAREVR